MADPGSGPGRAKVSERVEKAMLKPLIFGNHQKFFTRFSYLVSFGILYYMVFEHDFGEKRHCFSWIREYSEKKKKEFFSIDPNDELLLMKKEQNVSKNTPVISQRTNE